MTNYQFKKSALLESEQRLIEAIQTVGFGWLHGVCVENGQPSLKPMPKAVRELKLGAGHGPRPELSKADFLLKQEVIELLRTIKEINSGIISIECRHGLPARVRYEMEGVGA